MFKSILVAATAFGLISGSAVADNNQWPRFRDSPQIQAGVGLSLTDPTFPLTDSTGVLIRERDRITVDGSFTGLSPNHAYSLHWFIFNDPAKCDFGCTLPDVELGSGQIFYAGGFISDENGYGKATATLPAGRIPQGAQRFSEANDPGIMVPPQSESGLRQPFRAEISLLVRNKSPVNQPFLASQVGSYTGGCSQHAPEGDGEFKCFAEQSILFPPIPRFGS